MKTKALARAYTDLHEGEPPASLRRVKVAAPPKQLIELGPLSDVVYEKATPEGRIPYHHDFADHARPILARDERGKLHVLSGQYTVTAEGITDMKRRHRHGSKYTFGGHSRSNPSHHGRKHRRGKSRHAMMAGSRRNPSAESWLKDMGVALAAAGVYELASTVVLNHAPKVRDLDPSKRMMVQGGVGIALGFLSRKMYPRVALGLAVGGGTSFVEGALAASTVSGYIDRMFARAISTIAPSNTPAGSSSAPSQGIRMVGRGAQAAGLPEGARSGMPAGHRAMPTADCG